MTLLLVLAAAFILVSVFLACRLVSLSVGVRRLADALREIRKTGFQRRAHLGFDSLPLRKLGAEINALMDGFQDTLEGKQRLEVSHRQLIANISHDIRTPLTSLLGYVEVLKERKLGPAEHAEYLDIVHAKARSMHGMIEEFFDLATLESDDTVMEMERVDLAECVREELASFYHEFTRASITPELRLPERPVEVWGNRASIERVLDNLLSNALKYGADGGAIGVSIREEADRAWVDVRDRGRGIEEDKLPYVFDRLYTAEASRSCAGRGTGLGLAIARQLMAKQHGEITVTSTPGVQTVFSFCLEK